MPCFTLHPNFTTRLGGRIEIKEYVEDEEDIDEESEGEEVVLVIRCSAAEAHVHRNRERKVQDQQHPTDIPSPASDDFENTSHRHVNSKRCTITVLQ